MNMETGLSVVDQRRAARHTVNHRTTAEHRRFGEFEAHIVNISDNGFMTQSEMPIGKGESITVHLPVIGVINAHMIWTDGKRAGFQFERVIRLDEFFDTIDALHPVSDIQAVH